MTSALGRNVVCAGCPGIYRRESGEKDRRAGLRPRDVLHDLEDFAGNSACRITLVECVVRPEHQEDDIGTVRGSELS